MEIILIITAFTCIVVGIIGSVLPVLPGVPLSYAGILLLHFTEKVQALRLADFEKMMEEAEIYLLDIFGNYKLQPFYKNQSERLIMIFK